MTTLTAKPSGLFSLDLGEGPVWNPVTQQLSIVDIFSRQVHLLEFENSELRIVGGFETEGDIGAALPLADGSFVLCENHGIFLRDKAGSRELISRMPVAGSNFRCNDAKIGPDGNLWVGIMDYDAIEGKGSLWRISRSGEAQQLLTEQTIPNGLEWLGNEFWFVNGPAEEIRCYWWDSHGLVDSGKRFLTNGTPDGLAADSNGNLWLALWGEGRVDNFNQKGEVVQSVSVASPHSTSLCFAGENLDTLVMTSAKFNMSQADLEKYESAGDLFTAGVGTSGLAPNLKFD